jgi:hypothetical protein
MRKRLTSNYLRAISPKGSGLQAGFPSKPPRPGATYSCGPWETLDDSQKTTYPYIEYGSIRSEIYDQRVAPLGVVLRPAVTNIIIEVLIIRELQPEQISEANTYCRRQYIIELIGIFRIPIVIEFLDKRSPLKWPPGRFLENIHNRVHALPGYLQTPSYSPRYHRHRRPIIRTSRKACNDTRPLLFPVIRGRSP